MSFADELKRIMDPTAIRTGEPMSRHTTFRIGGPADYFVEPSSEELMGVIDLCRKEHIAHIFIGNGSNLLVGDLGIRGVVICFGRRMGDTSVEIKGNRGFITAGAGAMLSSVASLAASNDLAGMEFASGIPGTVGGGIFMNAGAYGGELKDILDSVTVLTRAGKTEVWDKSRYNGGYRQSAVSKEGAIALKAVFKLPVGNPAKIKEKTEELKEKRIAKQPLDMPSAGSTFKRPKGQFAGKLIQDAGLRGFTVGGAQVSEKHCGFVVNTGHATARDVFDLIKEVTEKVRADSGIVLEPEIRIIGEF